MMIVALWNSPTDVWAVGCPMLWHHVAIGSPSAYNPSRKGEQLPMCEDVLRGWFYTGVVVLALALWIAWYRVA